MSQRETVLGAVGTIAASAVIAMGCGEIGQVPSEPVVASPQFVVVGAEPCGTTDLEVGVLKLIKVGGSGSFLVEVTDLEGNEARPPSEVSLDDGDCAVVFSVTSSFFIVTVTETSGTPSAIGCDATFLPCEFTENSVTVHVGKTKGAVVTFTNMAPGRMTGGGFQIRVDGARVTRGLTLHCDITLSNNLEINWPGGNNWHLERESLSSVSCIDDPNFNPEPPPAPFDTFTAEAVGSLNGVDGSIIRFTFIDDGEPGRTDEAHFTIWAPGDDPDDPMSVPVLQVSGQLDGGNLQAHFDQPHS